MTPNSISSTELGKAPDLATARPTTFSRGAAQDGGVRIAGGGKRRDSGLGEPEIAGPGKRASSERAIDLEGATGGSEARRRVARSEPTWVLSILGSMTAPPSQHPNLGRIAPGAHDAGQADGADADPEEEAGGGEAGQHPFAPWIGRSPLNPEGSAFGERGDVRAVPPSWASSARSMSRNRSMKVDSRRFHESSQETAWPLIRSGVGTSE